MTDREKLLDLICGSAAIKCEYPTGKCTVCHTFVDHLISRGVTVQKWIPVEDGKPKEFVSVIGHMTDAGDFPAVRECYLIGESFFFPALREVHPVDKWMPMPGEG